METPQDTVVPPAEAPAPEAGLRKSTPTEHLYRFCQADGDSADDETREIQVAFSSEAPVLRTAGRMEEELGIATKGTKYYELLSHEKGHADFSQLNRTGAPLLDEHKNEVQIGNVKRARLSRDKRGRAVLAFDGITDLSKTRYQQMRDGSRPNISFGYVHTRFIRDDGEKNGIPIKRIAFAADEISSVARPADPTVGARRTADGNWCCLGCGESFLRGDLNDFYECADCATQRAARENQTRSQNNMERPAIRDLTQLKTRAASGEEISLEELRKLVWQAALADERFVPKDAEGESKYCCWVLDILIEEKGVVDGQDVDVFKAVLQSSAGKYFEVTFTFDATTATLGEAVEVAPKTSYEPVSRSAQPATHNPQPETKPPVDSPTPLDAHQRSQTESQPNHTPMSDKIHTAEDLESAKRSTRTAVEQEIQTRSQRETETLRTRNAEINGLADQYVKDYGTRWNGKPGSVFVVGERIRALQMEAVSAPADHAAAEVRAEFKRKVNEIIEGSREPKNQSEAAILPHELASRCSLGNILRTAMRTSDKWQGNGRFDVSEGAEYEADREIRTQAQEFPGGPQNLPAGILLPMNMPTGVRSNTPVNRLKRDAAAGDFATAGALISPEYIFPAIELLRNFPALARAGMTILGGVQGNLVLPRQTAAVQTAWGGEGDQLTAYDQTFDQIKMEPHRIGSTQNYSRLALIQPTPDFEALIMADHMAQIALGIDYAGLNGTGNGNQPLGVLNQVGIGSVTFAGSAANAYKNAVALETAVRKANIYEAGSYITTSASRGMLKSTAKLLVGATTVAAEPVWTDNETLQGRSAWDSQQVPQDILLYGVFRHLVMAQWGGLAVVLDTISKADKDQYKLTINTYVDFAVRHAQAFARSSDSLATLS